MRPSLFIIGGSGFLGGHLGDLAAGNWDTHLSFWSTPTGTDRRVKAVPLDIRSRRAVEKIVYELSPRVIINTAAVSGISQCEKNKDLAWEVNHTGAGHIADAARNIGARLVHISTDQVFDGIHGPYSETDRPNPLSIYGKSKLAADRYIRSATPDHCIVRPSLIYGRSLNASASCLQDLLLGLHQGRPYTGFTDEFRNPVYARELGAVILKLAKMPPSRDLFHVCGPETLSRYEFAARACAAFDLNTDLVIPGTSGSGRRGRLRPKNCSMDISKLQKRMGCRLSGVDAGLYHMKKAVPAEAMNTAP